MGCLNELIVGINYVWNHVTIKKSFKQKFLFRNKIAALSCQPVDTKVNELRHATMLHDESGKHKKKKPEKRSTSYGNCSINVKVIVFSNFFHLFYRIAISQWVMRVEIARLHAVVDVDVPLWLRKWSFFSSSFVWLFITLSIAFLWFFYANLTSFYWF